MNRRIEDHPGRWAPITVALGVVVAFVTAHVTVHGADIAAVSSRSVSGLGASAPGEMLVLTRDLRRSRGTLLAIDDRHVTFRDPQGTVRTAATPDVVAIVRVERDVPTERMFVAFADGQRFPGRPILGPEGLRWQHPLLGAIALDPERLALLRFESAPIVGGAFTGGPVGEATEDSVLLLNGDRLDGIVAAVGSTVQIERLDGTTQSVPLERVAAISFIHRPSGPSARWPATVWLADGSVVHAERPALGDDGILRLRPELFAPMDGTPDRPLLVPIDSVYGIVLVPDLLVPLATLQPESIDVPPFRLNDGVPTVSEASAPMGLSTVRFHGPVTVRYLLPSTNLRFVASIVMPEEARLWGDLEVVISDDGGERFRTRINAEFPVATVDLNIRSPRLTIAVEEGERGPIQDVLLFKNALLGPPS